MTEIDFTPVARRRINDDYDTPCPHDPECYVWESEDGPIPLCQMGDRHLLNAYRLVCRVLDYEADFLQAWNLPVSLGAYDVGEILAEEIALRGL